MEQVYQIVERRDSQELAAWLSENGQALLPMVELIEQGQMVVDEFIGVLGRAARCVAMASSTGVCTCARSGCAWTARVCATSVAVRVPRSRCAPMRRCSAMAPWASSCAPS